MPPSKTPSPGLKLPPKLSSITAIPEPSEAAKAYAAKEGADIRAYDPHALEAFIQGRLTLGELEGIGKPAQYELAKVGFAHLNEGKLKQAKLVFEGLLALDPYDAYFHTALGSIAQRQGDLDEALARYSRALEINPFFAVALAHRGEIRLSRGELLPAVDDFIAAIKEDPAAKDPATQRARALLATVRAELEAGTKK